MPNIIYAAGMWMALAHMNMQWIKNGIDAFHF